jgi:hypothetical protein
LLFIKIKPEKTINHRFFLSYYFLNLNVKSVA